MTFSICDLCDQYEDEIRIADPVFHDYGGRTVFGGEIVTVKCHEDNSFVRDMVAAPGEGKVIVVDGGGSLRRSLLGDQLAAQAIDNGWAGLVINGAIRDIELISGLAVGVKALKAIPLKTEKRGLGDKGIPVRFAGVTFTQGAHVYCDLNGLIVCDRALV